MKCPLLMKIPSISYHPFKYLYTRKVGLLGAVTETCNYRKKLSQITIVKNFVKLRTPSGYSKYYLSNACDTFSIITFINCLIHTFMEIKTQEYDQ